jgi:hypothetical protein
MGNQLHNEGNNTYFPPPIDFHNMQRGPDSNKTLNKEEYLFLLKQYLRELGVWYNMPIQIPPNVDRKCTNYKESLIRQRVLQFVWPQCIGVPMLTFHISEITDVNWWVSVFQPHVDYVLQHTCATDDGVFMFIGWTNRAACMGHLTLMYFNATNRTQTFFDPMQTYNDIMRNVSLASGYHPTNCVVLPTEPLQITVEQGDEQPCSPYNTCAVLCTMTVICCRRFGTSDIQGIAYMFQTAIRSHTNRTDIRHNLWVFYIQLGAQDMTYEKLLSYLGLIHHSTKDIHSLLTKSTCAAAVDRGNEAVPCNATVCVGTVYCPYHRQRLLNPNGMSSPVTGTQPNKSSCDIGMAVSRPVARNFPSVHHDIQNTDLCFSWLPPCPIGRALIQKRCQWTYVQIDELLELSGRGIYNNTITRHNTIEGLQGVYVRISGFTLNAQRERVLAIICDGVTYAAVSLDTKHAHSFCLVFDVAVVENSPPIEQTFINRMQIEFNRVRHFHAVVILWADKVLCFQTQGMDGIHPIWKATIELMNPKWNDTIQSLTLCISNSNSIDPPINLLQLLRVSINLVYVFVEMRQGQFNIKPIDPNQMFLSIIKHILSMQWRSRMRIIEGAIVRILPNVGATNQLVTEYSYEWEPNGIHLKNVIVWPGECVVVDETKINKLMEEELPRVGKWITQFAAKTYIYGV